MESTGTFGAPRNFIRYCAAGGTAALSHFLVLIGLVELFEVVPISASAVGFGFAVILNYTLQYYWTFAAVGRHFPKFFRFGLIAMLALVFNLAIFWLCNIVFGLPYLLSQAFATGTVVLINFQLNRMYVFTDNSAQ